MAVNIYRNRSLTSPAPTRLLGPAFQAEQARNALGFATEEPQTKTVASPTWLWAISIVIVTSMILVRPQALGLRNAVFATSALGVFLIASILAFNRLAASRFVNPGVESTILPAAVMISFAGLLSRTTDLRLQVSIAIAASGIIALGPYFHALRKTNHEKDFQRLTEDFAGIIVLVAAVFAALWRNPTTLLHLALVFGVSSLVTFDALRNDAQQRSLAARNALLTSVIVVGLTWFSPPHISIAMHTSAVLLAWYGLRGLWVTRSQVGVSHRIGTFEYGAFIAGSAGLLVYFGR